MREVKVQRTIRAPREEVFEVTAHIEHYAEVIPGITGVEFLSDQRTGEGTVFRETRRMGKRSATTELEVTGYDPPKMTRIVSDEGGTIWDTIYTYAPTEDGTELTMVMEIRPHTFLARLTAPIAQRMVTKAIEADMDAVKAHCEGTAG